MTLQVQIVIIEICMLVLIATTVYNFFRVQSLITTMWEMIKELQQRRIH